jgi:putative transposase
MLRAMPGDLLSSDGRRNPASGVLHIPHEQTIVYLTVTTDRRTRWLAAEEPQRLLVETWKAARGWLVGYYILIPDHLHCLCVPGAGNFTIERWLAYWKDQFGKKHRHEGWDWQSRGWHHRLRSDESLEEKWHYMRNNPVVAGLVRHPDDWPWQGRIHDLGQVTLG